MTSLINFVVNVVFLVPDFYMQDLVGRGDDYEIEEMGENLHPRKRKKRYKVRKKRETRIK